MFLLRQMQVELAIGEIGRHQIEARIVGASDRLLELVIPAQQAADGGCVFVCNHQSTLDVPAVIAALPGQLRFLAKASLFRLPVVGWYMKRVGYIPVDRCVFLLAL